MTHGDSDSDVETFLRHPLAWVIGAIASIAAVIGTIFADPTGTVATIILTLTQQASIIFTGLSIAGFTLAPEFPQIPQREIQILAIIFGLIFIAQIIDRVWDNIKDRVNGGER